MLDIGPKIRQRRTRLGWTIQKLATLAGVDRGFLSKIETGKTDGSWDTYTKLAGALGVSIDVFLVGTSGSNVQDVTLNWRQVPVLNPVQAARWSAELRPGEDDLRESVVTDLERPSSTFAMRIHGDSMEPDFKDGDVVVIDPTLEPKPGDFVVGKDQGGEANFRQYRSMGINEHGHQVFELRPLNSIYAPMRSDRQQLAIVGVMVEHRRYRRR